MSFQMTRMDERVLAYIDTGGRTGRTLSEVQRYFTADRAGARTAVTRLRAARYVRIEPGFGDHYLITDQGRNAL